MISTPVMMTAAVALIANANFMFRKESWLYPSLHPSVNLSSKVVNAESGRSALFRIQYRGTVDRKRLAV